MIFDRREHVLSFFILFLYILILTTFVTVHFICMYGLAIMQLGDVTKAAWFVTPNFPPCSALDSCRYTLKNEGDYQFL